MVYCLHFLLDSFNMFFLYMFNIFSDFDCILTNLNLNKIDKNKFQLTKIELLRTENILKRAIDVEAGVSEVPRVTEEHPDGCK